MSEPTTEPTNEPTQEPTTPPEGDDLASKLAAAEGKLDKSVSAEKNLRERLKALEGKASEYDKLMAAQQTAEEKAQAEAKAANDRVNALIERAVKAEAKALASDKFQDPEDATAFLKLSEYAADGDVNTDALRADLDALLERKPHLAKSKQGPKPNPAQGSSGSTPPDQNKGQLTRDDLKRMTPDQINKASDEGRLNDLLGIK